MHRVAALALAVVAATASTVLSAVPSAAAQPSAAALPSPATGPTPATARPHTPGPTPATARLHTPGPTPATARLHTPGPTPATGRPHTPGALPEAVTYQAPVDGPVVDGFRPPTAPYGAGNRGVDYATQPGAAVRAAAAGMVAFSGRVGAGRHVVVLHADGIRTSYSFLASLDVRRGQRVVAGQPLGTSAAALHFGARAGDAYLDPLQLLAVVGRAQVRLVPDVERAMGSEGAERSALRRFLGAVSGAVSGVGGTAISWARGAAGATATALPSAGELQPWISAAGGAVVPRWVRTALAVREAWAEQGPCTPPGVDPPVPPTRRRAVLVGGLGSTSEGASVDDVDTDALGYRPSDVVRFSYRGGTTTERRYGAADTQVDIHESGRRLRELLERLHAADPGVPIDLITHSQGGLVARSALGSRAPPDVVSLVTLGTPHHGADLATLLARTARTPKGAVAQAVVAGLGVSGINPMSTSVRQLAETSDFIRAMEAQPLPPGVRVTSIAARADVVVPSPRSRLAGAANAVVSVPGLNEHSALPGSDVARREIALSLAGMDPTCQKLGDAVADLVVAEAVATAESLGGLVLVAAGS